MTQTELERWLIRHKAQVLGGERPPGDHLSEARLAEVCDRGGGFDDRERAHLAACSECLHEAIVLFEAQAPRPISILQRPAVRVLLAAAAMIAAVLIFLPRDPHFAPKGAPDADLASVSLIASGAEGATRDARDGGVVGLDERLGFRYGNPRGDRKTLTVLGWDGRELHWYYPESADQPPFALRSGPDARNLRLPFEIRLSEKHRAGPLEVYAAFDVEPRALAAAIESGSVKKDRSVTAIRLTLRAGAAR